MRAGLPVSDWCRVMRQLTRTMGMEDYKVTLSEQERGAELRAIAGKGTRAASRVINALILLDCEQSGERTELE